MLNKVKTNAYKCTKNALLSACFSIRRKSIIVRHYTIKLPMAACLSLVH